MNIDFQSGEWVQIERWCNDRIDEALLALEQPIDERLSDTLRGTIAGYRKLLQLSGTTRYEHIKAFNE